VIDTLPVLIRSSIVAVQLLCVPVGGRHFGSRPALEALKDTLRSFCAAPALMPKYAFLSPQAPVTADGAVAQEGYMYT